MIKDPDPEQRLTAIECMKEDCKELKPLKKKLAEFAPLIGECLNDANSKVRASAVKALVVFKVKYYARFIA